MEKPVIYYVDDEIQFLDAIRQELSRRYAADYEVLGESIAGHRPGKTGTAQKVGQGSRHPAGGLLDAGYERRRLPRPGSPPVPVCPARPVGRIGEINLRLR